MKIVTLIQAGGMELADNLFILDTTFAAGHPIFRRCGGHDGP